ncbi:polysaccharide pyruvyl transferase family protein, partial [Aestuariimicrobium ganziense]|uniref:polysaccharide pyruvyl transferase family protein n=1 Tax=Aestuariimicrobium ganziense TaxID=2773677 RepID=UPI0019458F7B
PAPLAARPGPFRGARQTLKSLYFLARPGARSLPEALREVKRSAVVVSKGGYVFVDRKSARDLLSMWSTVFPLVFAHRVGVPVAAFPTSISPQEHRGSRWLNRWLLSRMELVFPRDPLSAAAARHLGASEAAVVEVPDIVLGMAPPNDRAVAEVCLRTGVRRGGFATMTVQLKNRGDRRDHDLAALHRTADALLARPEVETVLVINQAGDDRDSRDLVALIGPGARLAGADLSPEELVALYAGSVLTVACRLHSAIFALVAGTPAIAVSVTPLKAEGVYASVGLPSEWVVPIDDVDRAPGLVDQVLAHPAATRERIRSAVASTATRLAPVSERLTELLRARH